MITINTNKINTLNQNSYDILINSIDFNLVTCSCGHTACLTKHAYYERSIKTATDLKITLTILRVKCSVCGKTHAVLLHDIVPYSQVSLKDQIVIIDNAMNGKPQDDVMNNNPLIDESTISYVIRSYKKYWQQRLTSFKLTLQLELSHLSSYCFKYFARQFMQIKCTVNVLYSKTHIT